MKFYILILSFLCSLFVAAIKPPEPLAADDKTEKDIVVWSQSDRNRYSLMLSRNLENHWSPPETIAQSPYPIILPTFSTIDNGEEICVIWTQINGACGRIRYATSQNGKWSSTQSLKTETTSDMAPVSMADDSGIVWLLWSGTDAIDDDIYYSRWIGNRWQAPKRINKNDRWPDILPSITLDHRNRVMATWLGFNGERYVTYSCHWIREKWSREYVVGEIPAEMDGPVPDLPDFIPVGSQVSIRSNQSKPIQKFVKPHPISAANDER